MPHDPILHLLGLAKKAGRLEIGEEPVGAAARAHQARVLLLAADAAPNTVRRAAHFGEAGGALWLQMPFTKAELGEQLGRSSCAMLAVTDVGFAAALAEKLAARDEERYGPAAQQLRAKADRALHAPERNSASTRKICRQGKHKPWAAPPSPPQQERKRPRRQRPGGSGAKAAQADGRAGRRPGRGERRRTFPGKPGPGGAESCHCESPDPAAANPARANPTEARWPYMMNKYRVHEVAKDFKLNSKDIAEILTKYSQTPKNHMQVLEDRELSVIFEYLTQHNQVESIESPFMPTSTMSPSRPRRQASPADSRAPAKPARQGRQPAAPQQRRAPGRQERGAAAALRAGQPAAGPGPPRHPRAGEEGGGHPQGRQTSTWRSTTSGWRSWSPTSVSRTQARQAEVPGPQRPAPARRPAGFQGNKRKPGGAGADAPPPAGDRQEGPAEGADPRRDRRGRAGQPDEEDRRRGGQVPHQERGHGLPQRHHRLRHRRHHRRGDGLQGGEGGGGHHRGAADRRPRRTRRRTCSPAPPWWWSWATWTTARPPCWTISATPTWSPARPAASPSTSAPIRWR